MDCKQVVNHLPDYAENDLPPFLRRQVDRHLEQCYACVEELRDLVDLLDRTRQILRHPRPENRFAALQSQIERDTRREWSLRPRFTVGMALKSVLAAAAAVVLIIGAGRLLMPSNPAAYPYPAFGQGDSSRLNPQPNWLVTYPLQVEAYLQEYGGMASDQPVGPPAPETSQPLISLERKAIGHYA